jgi:hypothetical protein
VVELVLTDDADVDRFASALARIGGPQVAT